MAAVDMVAAGMADTAAVDMAAADRTVVDMAAADKTAVDMAAAEIVPARRSDCLCQINCYCPSISPSDISLINVETHHGHNHITGQDLCATNIDKNF